MSFDPSGRSSAAVPSEARASAARYPAPPAGPSPSPPPAFSAQAHAAAAAAAAQYAAAMALYPSPTPAQPYAATSASPYASPFAYAAPPASASAPPPLPSHQPYPPYPTPFDPMQFLHAGGGGGAGGGWAGVTPAFSSAAASPPASSPYAPASTAQAPNLLNGGYGGPSPTESYPTPYPLASGGGLSQDFGYPAASATPGEFTSGTFDASFDAEAELLFLNKLESKAFALQRRGHHLYAAELMEQSVASRKLLYGPLSPEVLAAAEKLALLYNALAMSALYKEEYKPALRLLRKAELLTSHIGALASVRVQSLNNLSCAYRRLARPKTALNLLREALVLLSAERVTEGRGVTHLNMCAILSQLNRHEEAREHAKAAVMHCQQHLLVDDRDATTASANESQQAPRTGVRVSGRRRRSHRDAGSDSGDESDSDSSSVGASSDRDAAARAAHDRLAEKVVILGISYHNLAVEEEFLGRRTHALEWYAKALELARDHVGPKEEITRTFRESYEAARKQADAIKAQERQQEQKQQQQQQQHRYHHSASTQSASASARPSSRLNTHLRASRPASAASSRSAASSTASYAQPSHPSAPVPRAPSASAGVPLRRRPASAAPRDRDRAPSAGGSAHFASQAELRAPPSYTQGTDQSARRQRPKSASVSRPPRPR